MSRQRRILIVTDTLQKGGLARVMIALSSGFARLGCSVGLVSLNPTVDYAVDPAVWRRVHAQVEPTSGLARMRHRRVLADVIRGDISAFEAEFGVADLVLVAGEMAMRCVHELDHPHLLISSHSSQLQSPKYANVFGQLKYEFKIFRRGHRVRGLLDGKNLHTVSEGLAHELTDVLGVKPKSLHVINNPFDIVGVQHAGEVATPESIAQVTPFIVGIGEFNYRKSFDRLIRAFSECRFTGDLVLVGQGVEEDNLKRLARDCGVAARVKFLPFHANHYALLRNAKLLVLTSRSEGLPNVLVEAILLGVPAVSVDCPHGPRDILLPIEPDALIPIDRLDLLPERIDRFVNHPYPITNEQQQRFGEKAILAQYMNLMNKL